MKRLDVGTQIRYLKGIGPKKALLFQKLGIHIIDDLLYYFPRRYQDRSSFTTISKLKEGQIHTIKARVLAKGGRNSFRRKGFSITEVAVGDASGRISCVWFNQPYLKDYFKVGQSLVLYGKIERYGNQLQMSSPEFEIVIEEEGESLNTGGIIPVYSLPEGLTQRSFRSLVKRCLDECLPSLKDFLPYDIRLRNKLLNLAQSLINIHFPVELGLQKQAYRRLAFEEFFLFQIPLALRKLKRKEKVGIAHKVDGGLAEAFIDTLPFKFTSYQEKVIAEIKADMAKPTVMQRLLQGDVGSGKTVVAAVASLFAVQGGYQVAFMVPTEILAQQHYEKICSQLLRLRSHNRKIKLGFLAGCLSNKEKQAVYQEIKGGKIDIIIGTHALLEADIAFKNLGLVVIDEQHKFGVGQRALLSGKGLNPDILIMTATPIPRTLAITIYGDLDVSVIKGLPPGRKPIKTVHFNQEEKGKAYLIAREQLLRRNQVYIVYPVIEESYALDIAGATKMYNQFKEGEFKEFKLGLIHGKLKEDEQNLVMGRFKQKSLDILVSTTILEVGIDISSATCMIIEHAERFGLSQLHQLRGRVGRGAEESYCLLISRAQTEEAKRRLQAMVEYGDGFKIAEEDLRIRGPGEFFGERQHGLAELKIANPLTQMQLLKKAREEAIRLVNNEPCLSGRQSLLLKAKLMQRFPEYEKLMVVG
ncbi:ATP-dependent DNA helicase RecG [bacterium]|nr:MAG: ATP-dependent DNA helicase RecG [bacterium]